MKKTITLLCCMAMVVSLASCGEPAPLTEGHALTACKRQAKIEAPKGFYYKLSNVDITDNDDGTIRVIFNDATVNQSVVQTVVCDVGGTNDRPSILTFGDIRGLNNESDKQDTSEQLKQQSGEKSGETAFLSATVKIIDGNIQINTSGKVEYSPLITVYSVTGDEASFLPLGNDANTIVKADGSKTSISSSDYTWKYDQKGDATFSISLNPAEYMGISDPIDRVELAAYMRSAKRTIGKNIVLNFD